MGFPSFGDGLRSTVRMPASQPGGGATLQPARWLRSRRSPPLSGGNLPAQRHQPRSLPSKTLREPESLVSARLYCARQNTFLGKVPGLAPSSSRESGLLG